MINRKRWMEMRSINFVSSNLKILQDINLEFFLGDVITILGPNGSGKSTLIKLINRSIYPSVEENYKFTLFEKELINIWELREQIGFFHTDLEKRFKPNITCIEVLLTGLYGSMSINSQKITTQKDFARAKEFLELFSLEDQYKTEYQKLSDGKRRSLLLARSLINNPKVLVLDEPTINLDINSHYNFLTQLSKNIKNGLSIVLVTNSIDSIIKETNRVLFIKGGKIIKNGSTKEILNSKNLSNLFGIDINLFKVADYWRQVPKISLD